MNKNTWDNFYKSGNVFVSKTPVPHAVEVCNIAEKYIRVAGSNILDVGCGPANLSIAFKTAGARTVGIDLNEDAVKIASEIIDESIVADAFDIPYSDEEFDLVISGGLLEHFTDDEVVQLLQEQARVSNNYIMAMIPNPEDTIYRAWKRRCMDTGLWNFGTERPIDLIRLADNAGLRPVESVAINSRHTANLLRELSEMDNRDYSALENVINSIGDNIGYLKVVVISKYP